MATSGAPLSFFREMFPLQNSRPDQHGPDQHGPDQHGPELPDLGKQSATTLYVSLREAGNGPVSGDEIENDSGF
jgi:hypothetical protein